MCLKRKGRLWDQSIRFGVVVVVVGNNYTRLKICVVLKPAPFSANLARPLLHQLISSRPKQSVWFASSAIRFANLSSCGLAKGQDGLTKAQKSSKQTSWTMKKSNPCDSCLSTSDILPWPAGRGQRQRLTTTKPFSCARIDLHTAQGFVETGLSIRVVILIRLARDL